MKRKYHKVKVVAEPVKPVKRRGWMAWLIVGALAVAVGLWTVLHFGKKETVDDNVRYILAKLTPTPVCEDKMPVLIFQYNDGGVEKQASGMEKVNCNLAGSGTMIKMQDGNYCVITSEHLFSVHRPCNYEAQKYMVQVLREGGNIITRNLADARPFFQGKPGLIDVAVCRVSVGGEQKIIPFSPYQGHDGEAETRSEHNLCGGKPEDKIVRSLVSGETVALLAMDQIPGTGGMYTYLVDYDSVPGESGTGFVDRNGNLFVLKGSLTKDANGVEGTNKKLRELGVISEDKKGFSTLVGLFTVKTNQNGLSQ